jgi:hypothetical protein
MTKLIPSVLLAIVFGCSSKPTWTEYKTGPVTMQFPCSPGTSAAVTKCVRSDGSEYAISVVDKGGISDEEELKQSKEYAENIPYGTLVKMDAFPLRWRESRRTVIIDSTLYYKGGKEYVVSVSYTTEKPPAIVEEYLSKVKVE